MPRWVVRTIGVIVGLAAMLVVVRLMTGQFIVLPLAG